MLIQFSPDQATSNWPITTRFRYTKENYIAITRINGPNLPCSALRRHAPNLVRLQDNASH